MSIKFVNQQGQVVLEENETGLTAKTQEMAKKLQTDEPMPAPVTKKDESNDSDL